MFFVFVPLGFLFFDRTFRLQEFLLNLFCVDYSYNREWWFMGTYIELLLVLPLVLRLDTKKYFLVAVLLVAIALRFLSGFFELNSGGGLIRIFINLVTISPFFIWDCFLVNILYLKGFNG